MKISAIDRNAPINLTVVSGSPFVTRSYVDGVVTFPAIKLSCKKSLIVNE
ncbi:MAG: hypothetical protein NTZ47_08590 [Bacteroidetes bacterium]|nr:hypothetical protein [Bacteroidota bacterium]